MRRAIAIGVAFAIGLASHGQRLLRSHLLQVDGGDDRCVLVIRKYETYSDPELIVFRYANAKRLWPGDYHIAYFVDTGFVFSEWTHVGHEKSLVDQWIVLGRLPLDRLRFGNRTDSGSVWINVPMQ